MVEKEQIFNDDRFCINTQIPDRLFQTPIKKIDVISVKLGNLLCYYDDKVQYIKETSISKFLEGGSDSLARYEMYCEKYPNSFRTVDTYKTLIDQMSTFEYDIKKGAIVINQLGIIIDGQHRCSILMKKYGEDFKIEVVRFYYDSLLLRLRQLVLNKKTKDYLFSVLGKGIYKNGFLERLFVSSCYRHNHGEFNSTLLRRYFGKFYNIEAGLYSYGCFNHDFNFGGKCVRVGRYCSIASDVHFFGANHPQNCLSTSAVFYNPAIGYDVTDVERNTLIIEDDVWIGHGVKITSSCKRIGRGSIIAAGSIVTKNVNPYEIVAGNPAKLIKKRFDETKINMLEKSYWWLLNPEQLIPLISLDNTTHEEFIEKCHKLIINTIDL